jgi:enamine deaminase RidA (YjgF/YER057c/UK114 family)
MASSGIEGKNSSPTQLVFMDTYSIAGIKSHQVQFLQAPNHMCPTHLYGVTFERGTAISFGDRKHIYISGTASIDKHGDILYPDNAEMQTQRAIENIQALLHMAGSCLQDMASVLIYIRDGADYSRVQKTVSELLPDVPAIILLAPICRPGWLVEIEGVAISKHRSEWTNF